jgi:hypothetical protein
VTWAREDVFFRAEKYWAGGVRAEAAECEKCAVGWMQQEARMLVIWVGNNFHTADRDVFHLRYYFDWVGTFSSADEDDESTDTG